MKTSWEFLFFSDQDWKWEESGLTAALSPNTLFDQHYKIENLSEKIYFDEKQMLF